jgi:tRNA 2-selenouridine synthase
MREPIVLSASEVVARLDDFNAILDARSPSEYALDHLPGAISAAVLDDAQRAEVGTVNAEQGAFEAKRLGAGLVAQNIGQLIATRFAHHGRDWKPLVYCWRGGQRSGSLATVMARIGWHTSVMEGGYRAFRRYVIDDLSQRAPAIPWMVVAGRTGSAKSRLLQALAQAGEQVLDLEDLARHRGSVLGAWPGDPQPAQKHFETCVWDALRRFDLRRPVFVESESRKIGQCQVPEPLIHAMRASTVVVIEADVAVRSRFLLDEYVHFRSDPPGLMRMLDKLIALHGAERVAQWRSLIEADQWDTLVERLLREHYDPSYDRSMQRNFTRLEQAATVTLPGADAPGIAQAVQSLIALAAAQTAD